MSENIIVESEKRLNSLQSSIETATGESYKDLTEAVNVVIEKSRVDDHLRTFIAKLKDPGSVFLGYKGKKLPVLDVSNGVTFNEFCRDTDIEEIDYFLNFGANKVGFAINLHSAFMNSTVKRIVGFKSDKVNMWTACFSGSLIEEIETPLDLTSAVGGNTYFRNVFDTAYYIKKIFFVPETIRCSITFKAKGLTAESVQSIVEGLATITGANTLTLPKEIPLTDEQKATISNKGWTLVLS